MTVSSTADNIIGLQMRISVLLGATDENKRSNQITPQDQDARNR